MLGPEGFNASHQAPNDEDLLQFQLEASGVTTDEGPSPQPSTTAGNSAFATSLSTYRKTVLIPRPSDSTKLPLQGGDGGENGGERDRLTLALVPDTVPSTIGKEKRKKNPLIRRTSSQDCGGGEERSVSQPRQKKISPQPFACPSFQHDIQHNKILNAQCGRWRNVKLSQVRQHCIEEHVKPLRCGRCRTFKAGTPEEIFKHLQERDCEKSHIPDPSEADAIAKASEIEKAKTWERIYEVLYPQIIPDPFWQPQLEQLSGATQNSSDVVPAPETLQGSQYNLSLVAEYDNEGSTEDLGCLFLGGITTSESDSDFGTIYPSFLLNQNADTSELQRVYE